MKILTVTVGNSRLVNKAALLYDYIKSYKGHLWSSEFVQKTFAHVAVVNGVGA